MWLTRIAISRPVAILMVFGMIAVLGWRSLNDMQVELNPRVDFPFVSVVTVYPGAGPEEIETLITDKIEEAISTINHVNHITSVSFDGLSQVMVEFTLEANSDVALSDTRSKIDAILNELPRDAEKPVISKFDISALPVVLVGLTGPVTPQELKHLADKQVSERLQQVAGVAAVSVVGGADREIRVALDKGKLSAYGLSINDVVSALGTSTLNLPSGRIRETAQEFPVRVIGEFQSVEQIESARLHFMKKEGQGELRLQMKDLGRVTDTVAEPQFFARANSNDAVVLSIQKTSDANTVRVVEGAKKEMQSLLPKLGSGFQVSYAQDQSERVRESQAELRMHLMVDIILVVLVVLLFLHSLRGTLIVSLAIPTALLATFIPMRAFGFTLNTMTMLGLALVIGVLVDDAIVVLENIFRHLKDGETPQGAAFNGRTEIGLAALTITLVDVVVFVPIAFMGGIVGRFFREFGLTVAFATLFSLFVSFTLTPMLAARFFKRGETIESHFFLFRVLTRFFDWLDKAYRYTLSWALRHRGVVVVMGFASLVLATVFVMPRLGFQFFPVSDQGLISITVETPVGVSLYETDQIIRQIEPIASSVPDAESVFTETGRLSGGARGAGERGSNYGSVSLTLIKKRGLLDVLTPWRHQEHLRTRADTEIAAELRQQLAKIPGARIQVLTQSGFGGTAAPVQIELRGQNLEELVQVATEMRDRVGQVRGVTEPDLSWRVGVPEVQIRIDREKAADLGYSVSDVARLMRNSIEGDTTFKYRESGDEYDIRMQLARFDRNQVSDVANVYLGQVARGPVYLRDVAQISMGTGPNKIERKERERQVIVLANLEPGYPLGNAQGAINAAIKDVSLGSVKMNWGGQAELMRTEGAYLFAAMGLGVILVYMLMAALFESFFTPLVIMFSVPMAIVGGVLAMVITKSVLSIMSMIGFIMLIGLVTKNAILLLDYTNTLRKRGAARDDAIREAGPTRLRPILMTTLSIVFGLLPLSLKLGPGSEQRAPLAIAVQGGLILSTLLTLLVIPCLYSLMDDWLGALQRLGNWVTGRSGRLANGRIRS